MDRWFLIVSTLFAAVAGVRGLLSVRNGHQARYTVWWMLAAMICQLGYLLIRGELRGACPLRGVAEIAVYLGWSLTLFYLLVGPMYRISLLGMFSAPVVFLFQAYALLSGKLESIPEKILNTDPWGETHAATSVLAYGALALSAVAGVMFLVLDRLLKGRELKGGLFRNLPPVRELLVSLERLLWLGMGLLTLGIIAGFLMPHGEGAFVHLLVATLVWLSYAALMTVARVRGLTGRKLALGAVFLFVFSLGVFAFI